MLAFKEDLHCHSEHEEGEAYMDMVSVSLPLAAGESVGLTVQHRFGCRGDDRRFIQVQWHLSRAYPQTNVAAF